MQINISLYKNTFDKHPTTENLQYIIEKIKSSKELKKSCLELQGLTEKKAKNDFKIKQLPAITVSGVFSNGHAAKDLKEHSGLIQMDFDNVPNFIQLKEKLLADKYTFVLFNSPSGTGLKVFVKIKKDKHNDSFKGLENYYKEVYKFSVDSKCKDEGRLCFLSYDENIFVNEASEIFSKEIIQSKVLPNIKENNTKPFPFIQNTERDVKIVVDEIVKLNIDITNGYDNWIKIGFALAKGLSESGRDYFLLLSKINPQFDFNNANEQYTKCLQSKNSGITIKTFFHIAKKNGISITKENRKSKISVINNSSNGNENSKGHKNIVIQVEEFLNEHYCLRFNEVSNRIEEKKKDKDEWKDLNENNIYRYLLHNDFNISQAKLTAILRSDFVTTYNPFIHYFENLSNYDKLKEPDYIGNLCGYVYAKQKERFGLHLKKHLVRTVACAVQNSYYNKQAFIIIHDKQNSGKSTFCRWFCPPQLERYLGENVNLTNKDGEIALSEKFLINLDELAALSRYEINQLKSVMSRDRISVRRPFEKSTTESPRRCSFFGSTNRTEFLFDETGSVRWICFEIEFIKWDYKKDIDINRLWAQAFDLYKSGFKFDLSAEEITENETANNNFFVTTDEENLLWKYYRPGLEYDNDAFLTSTDILQKITSETNNYIKLSAVTLGKILTKNGFVKSAMRLQNTPTKGYYVKYVSK